MTGFPVYHQLPEIAQTDVGDDIQPSHPLSSLLLQPSIFPRIRVFSNESALLIRWPKYWNFSFSVSPSNEYSGVISFRLGFPCGSAGKESACNAGDLDSMPGLGRSPGEGKGYPPQYSDLENSENTVHGVTEWGTAERPSLSLVPFSRALIVPPSSLQHLTQACKIPFKVLRASNVLAF